MLGIAAYGLNGRTPPSEPVSWPAASPTVSAMPMSGTSRGGAIGSSAYDNAAKASETNSAVRSST